MRRKDDFTCVAATAEHRRGRFPRNFILTIKATGFDSIGCESHIAFRHLVSFRVHFVEGRRDGVTSFRSSSAAKALIHRFPRPVITDDQLHFIQENCFHCRCEKSFRSDLYLRNVMKRFFCKPGAELLPKQLNRSVELVNMLTDNGEKKALREVTMLLFLIAKIFRGRVQEEHTVRCVG